MDQPEFRKAAEKGSSKLSPSPEMPSPEQAQLNSLRSSRATSEARSEPGPESPYEGGGGGYSFSDPYANHYKSLRGGSEAPQREPTAVNPTSTTRRDPYVSYSNSRASSEAPERGDVGDDLSAHSSRGASEIAEREGYDEPVIPSPKRGAGKAKQSLFVSSAANPHRSVLRSTRHAGGAGVFVGKAGHRSSMFGPSRAALTVREHIRSVEERLYETVPRASPAFHFYQKLPYPLEDPMVEASDGEVGDNATNVEGSHRSASTPFSADVKEPSPQPRMGSHTRSTGAVDEARIALPPAAMLSDEISKSVAADGGSSSVAVSSVLDARISPNHPSAVAAAAAVKASSASSSDHGGNSHSPSPHFDEESFKVPPESAAFFNDAVDFSSESFRAVAQSAAEDSALQSVSVVAMTTLLDPISGTPVLGLCLGDYSGRIEYFEVSTADAYNSCIRRSKSLIQQQPQLEGRGSSSMPLLAGGTKRGSGSHNSDDVTGVAPTPINTASVETAATDNITHGMRGREILRRHSHRAFVKSINALTSVAVEPYVKCLCFARTRCSPSMVSYLTANERVIKLFHVRREGFSPFNAFPEMEDIIGKTFVGSRYFARLPPQPAILPIKEFGPVMNSIQALSVSADGETFMSVEDLQVFWWSFETKDTTKATCIADLRPASGALDEVEELVTAASFHPTHSSLFLLTRSSGILNIGDLRDPPSRDSRKYGISSQLTREQNPFSSPAYDEILCSISDASFLGPDHVLTRDYLSLKLWDLRRPDQPCATMPVMNHVSRYLDALYENDSIFDRFPVAVDDASGTVVTGLYDGAVAVWQPLHTSPPVRTSLVYYRADPFTEPSDIASGGMITEADLETLLQNAWTQTESSPNYLSLSQESGAGGDEEVIPEPFTNKVLTIAIAPGGERFCYTYKNGRLVYVFERKSDDV